MRPRQHSSLPDSFIPLTCVWTVSVDVHNIALQGVWIAFFGTEGRLEILDAGPATTESARAPSRSPPGFLFSDWYAEAKYEGSRKS